MLHRPGTWASCLFIDLLNLFKFFNSSYEWFRLFVSWCDSENQQWKLLVLGTFYARADLIPDHFQPF